MAQVEVVMTSEEARLWAGIQKVTGGFQGMEGAAKKTGRAHSECFGAKSVGEIAGYATGFLSVHKAIELVKSGIDDLRERERELAAMQKASRVDVSAFSELADTPAEMQELLARTTRYQAEAGVSKQLAAQAIFGLVSADVKGQDLLFAQMQRAGIMRDPTETAGAIGALQQSLGPSAGSARDVMNMALAAGKQSPGKATEVLRAAAAAGVHGGMVDAEAPEILAGVELLAKLSGKPDEAGTQMRALFRALAKHQGKDVGEQSGDAFGKVAKVKDLKVRGDDLLGTLEQIEALNLDPGELIKFFGRQEGVVAYRQIIANRDKYKRFRREIAAAPKKDLLKTKMKLYEDVPELNAAIELEHSKTERDIREEPLGTWETYAQGLMEAREEEDVRMGRGRFTRWMRGRAESLGLWQRGGEAFVRESARPQLGDVPGERNPVQERALAAIASMEAAARKQAAAADKLHHATRSNPTLGSPDADR